MAKAKEEEGEKGWPKNPCRNMKIIHKHLRQNCESFFYYAESSRKFEKIRFIASGEGAEILQKVAETSQKFADFFLQWPLPERPHK